jgi:sporulation protein YlmC with PRC-barrel domain
MARTMRPQDLIDSTVVDSEGSKIGKVGTVYLADDTRTPEWVTVKTGLFGRKESFVPLSGADIDKDGLHVNVGKDQVSEAPRMETDCHLSPGDSAELYRHYGLPMPRSAPDDRTTRTGREGWHMAGQAAGQPHGGRGMIRAEKRLSGSVEQAESGRVRLRKYVGNEDQTVSGNIREEQIEVKGDGKRRKA